MNIRILHLLDGARQAAGLTVIIDVFRAFSTACYVFGNGAECIIPVGDLEQAYALKREHPEFILMGERSGAKQPGFDYGNSPAEIEQVDFTGFLIRLLPGRRNATSNSAWRCHASILCCGSNLGATDKPWYLLRAFHKFEKKLLVNFLNDAIMAVY